MYKIKHISATSLKMYQTCPKQWQFKYIIKLKQAPNPAFIIGIAYHKGIELLDNPKNTLEKVIKIIKKDMLAKLSDEAIDRFGMVRKFLEIYDKNKPKFKVIESEWKFSISMPTVPVPIFGFLDKIIKGGFFEAKTSIKDFTDEDVRGVQTDIYAYAYRSRTGKMPTEIIYQIMNKVKYKRPNYKPQILRVTRTNKDMKRLEQSCKKFYQDVKQKKFNKIQGNHCFYCPFRQNCK